MRHAVFATALVVCTFGALTAVHSDERADRAYVDAVLDGLVREGVLTADQARSIKTDAEAAARNAAAEAPAQPSAAPPKPSWTDTIKFGGYTQARWLYYPDGDQNNEFMVRRAKIKMSAHPTERSEAEIQLDMGEGDATVQDAWVQYDLTPAGDWRVRAGQQNVPFGLETPQSSSVRLPLERNWVSRRFVPGERDTGVCFFWTSPEDHALFDQVKKTGLGEGDYGNVAIGFFNGQGRNEPEVNGSKHIAIRLSKPFKVDDRVIEAGATYYGGKYHSAAGEGADFNEYLFGLHAYLPPDPWGLQAEVFKGKEEGDDLDGYYVMGMYRPCEQGTAFVRYDTYNGSRKGKGLGNVYDRDRWCIGYAHMLDAKTKVTLEYDLEDAADGSGQDLLGLQMQVGY